MTPGQRELARHALGLPNSKRRSYRNYFCAGPEHSDWDAWMLMCVGGLAERLDRHNDMRGGDSLFVLTQFGAELALKSGEYLSREDFPKKVLFKV